MENVLTCDPITRRAPVRSRPAYRKPVLDVQQGDMFPLSLDEMVDADDACRVVCALVDLLDLFPLSESLPLKGAPNYEPRLLLKLWMFAMLDGERSSRRIEKRCRSDVRYKWLCLGLVPDHTTLCRFRRSLGERLDTLLAESVSLGRRAGMTGLGRVCIDGTKLPAAASQWRVFRYEAESADSDIAADDAPPRAGGERRKRVPLPSKDPDARTMRARSGQFIAGYNAQTLVECDTGLVTTVHVSNEASDAGMLEPTLAECLDLYGELPWELLADSGYDTPNNAQVLADLGIQAWVASSDRNMIWRLDEKGRPVCPQGHAADRRTSFVKNGARVVRLTVDECPACPVRYSCLTRKGAGRKTISFVAGADVSHWVMQRESACSEEGKAQLRERGPTVEFAYARMKDRLGFRRLALRGLQGARIEVTLTAVAMNMALIGTELGAEGIKRLLAEILLVLRTLGAALGAPWRAVWIRVDATGAAASVQHRSLPAAA